MARNQFDEFLDAIERLLKMFFPERLLYLIGGSISFLIGVYAGVQVIQHPGNEAVVNTYRLIASSSGFMFTAGGFLLLFNRVFRLFKQLFEHKLGK
jgi:hypothetical protein